MPSPGEGPERGSQGQVNIFLQVEGTVYQGSHITVVLCFYSGLIKLNFPKITNRNQLCDQSKQLQHTWENVLVHQFSFVSLILWLLNLHIL